MTERTTRDDHKEYQRQFFDKNVEFFTRPIPQDVEQRTQLIVSEAGVTKGSRVLDVGTGTGVLIKHFLDAGVKEDDIVACDLSQEMLAQARVRYPQITFWQGDVLELPKTFGKFDAIFFNACFANMFDRFAVLEHARTFLSDQAGRIVISQPVGRNFVEQLKEYEPQLVPHSLPTHDELRSWGETLNMRLHHFRDEGKFYLAILQASA